MGNPKWWLDGRSDLRWWQHRNPDPRIRLVGKLMMTFGAFTMCIGVLEVTGIA